MTPSRWLPWPVADDDYERLDLDHPEVRERIVEEVGAGVPVYYDRRWPMTRRFCRWLAARPELVRGRRVVVVGAGVGMEAVLAGRLADRVWINDMAPVALELQAEQLERNGVEPAGVLPGSFGDVRLPAEADLVLGCFVLYDETSADAMRSLLARAREAKVPVILADLDIGGHFSAMLDEVERPVELLLREEAAPGNDGMAVARIG